jgi:peptide/nickel transport system permease protein
MKLRDYIIRRLILLIPVFIGISFVTFTLSHCIGDPATAWITDKTSLARYNIVVKQHHLDEPLPVQYFYYINDLAHLDLGNSASQGSRPVIECIKDFFPATVELSGLAMIMVLILGIPIGIISAIYKDKMPDHLGRLFSLVGVSVPIFWFGLILQYIFYLKLDWMPLGSRLPLNMVPPPEITGLYSVDAVLTGHYAMLPTIFIHLLMPAFCLSFTSLAIISRMMRSSMLEVMTQDFIRTARAKGLSERVVIFKHALRNALTPTITVAGLAFGGLLSGTVLTETIFMWPGIGRWSVRAITSTDFASIMGFTLIVVIIYVFANLFVDILYAYLDPRVKYG